MNINKDKFMHRCILTCMFISIPMAIFLDFITLCRLFNESYILELYREYKRYKRMMRIIWEMERLIEFVKDLEKSLEKKEDGRTNKI